MTRILKSVLAHKRARSLLAAAVLTGLPTAALAGHHDDRNDRRDVIEQRARGQYNDEHREFDRRDFDKRDFDRHDFDRRDNDRRDFDRRDDWRGEDRVWVEPVYRTICDQRWVEPVYRTVTDRVWCEPVVQRVTERVWVPDKYETRPVDPFGRTVALKKVLVKCGHYEDRCRDVVIKPGHYDQVCRQELACAGHYENVERQELMTPGHWEVRERCATNDRPSVSFDFNIWR